MLVGRERKLLCVLILALGVSLMALGCGSDNPVSSGGFARVNLVVGGGSREVVEGSVQLDAPVPMGEIETFLIDVDRILLRACDDSSDVEEDPEEPGDPEDPELLLTADDDSTDADDDSGGHIVIFDAEEQPEVDNEIDLVDLTNLTDIISSAEVPPGDYTGVVLEISNPRLMLVDDGTSTDINLHEYLTNVRLTANGRMFASTDLLLAAGETVNLELLVHSIHLVETGGGDFVLTPQLRVEMVEEF